MSIDPCLPAASRPSMTIDRFLWPHEMLSSIFAKNCPILPTPAIWSWAESIGICVAVRVKLNTCFQYQSQSSSTTWNLLWRINLSVCTSYCARSYRSTQLIQHCQRPPHLSYVYTQRLTPRNNNQRRSVLAPIDRDLVIYFSNVMPRVEF